jgi:uncharacterized membrane protein YkvA (DUF1232 family)
MKKEQLNFIENLTRLIDSWSKTAIGQANPWLKYIRQTPNLAHLLVRLAADPAVPTEQKAKLATTIAYFISPMDLIPESFWGVLGYLDDIVVATWTIQEVLEHTSPEVVLKHWQGEFDLLTFLSDVQLHAPEMLTPEYYDKLKALFKN